MYCLSRKWIYLRTVNNGVFTDLYSLPKRNYADTSAYDVEICNWRVSGIVISNTVRTGNIALFHIYLLHNCHLTYGHIVLSFLFALKPIRAVFDSDQKYCLCSNRNIYSLSETLSTNMFIFLASFNFWAKKNIKI